MAAITRNHRPTSAEYARKGKRRIERIHWHAFWDGSDGRRHSRKFSINRYGEQRARELACQARSQALHALSAVTRK